LNANTHSVVSWIRPKYSSNEKPMQQLLDTPLMYLKLSYVSKFLSSSLHAIYFQTEVLDQWRI